MPSIYAAISMEGEFVAFWNPDENTLSFFNPNGMHEQRFNGYLTEWKEVRPHYNDRPDFKEYSDIINAAWHFLGLRSVHVEKDKIVLSKMMPGTFHPRIWRGLYSALKPYQAYKPINARQTYGSKYVQSTVAASSLFAYLVDIFRHVEPSNENLAVYGHKIRELLILACTEVESAWRAVLEENSKNKKKTYTTNDYFKLKAALHLDEWSVALKDYPDLDSLEPFLGWNGDFPTRSLSWYESYNAVKHNRESNFSQASLASLLNAMAALHIMQAAQWGPELFSFLHGDQFSPFVVLKHPTFDASDLYVPSFEEDRDFIAAPYFSDLQ